MISTAFAVDPEAHASIAAPPKGAHLVSCKPDPRLPARYPLPARGAVVGRSHGCDLALPRDGFVSRQHARIFPCGAGGWVIVDLASKNGTYVNGVRLRPGVPRVLRPGDLVALGLQSDKDDYQPPRLRFETSANGSVQATTRRGGPLD